MQFTEVIPVTVARHVRLRVDGVDELIKLAVHSGGVVPQYANGYNMQEIDGNRRDIVIRQTVLISAANLFSSATDI
jgi:hypothetical protein